MKDNKVLADIQYDIFSRIDGITTVRNTGYIDRTKIYNELLKFNIWLLKVFTVDWEVVPVPCDKIHWIEYNVNWHPVHIDCKEFFWKTYSCIHQKPIEISDVKQPSSTLQRDKDRKRCTSSYYPKRHTLSKRSWYEDNILKNE